MTAGWVPIDDWQQACRQRDVALAAIARVRALLRHDGPVHHVERLRAPEVER